MQRFVAGLLQWIVDFDFLEMVDTAPDIHHADNALFDEPKHIDNFGDALACQILEVTRFKHRHDTFLNVVGPLILFPGQHFGQFGSIIVDDLGGGKNLLGRLLGAMDDGVKFIGHAIHFS